MIEWRQVYLTFTNIAVTFQLILFPNGDIRFHYLNIPADMAYAVVGIENQSGDDGLMYWDGSSPWGMPQTRPHFRTSRSHGAGKYLQCFKGGSPI